MNNETVKNELIEIGKIPSGWKMVKLHELGENPDSVVAGPFGSNLKVSDYRDEGVPIIRLQNIERNRFLDKDIKYIDEEKAKELQYHSFKAGDLLLAKLGAPIGKTCSVPQNMGNGIVVADVVRIRISSEKAITQFMEFVLNCDYCTKQLNKQTIGTTRPRVNLTDVRELMIALPPLAEQQKIKSILSEVDILIHKTDEIIEQTQRLKKGLIHRLLTRGIGHTRFKKVKWLFGTEIEVPNDWEIKAIGDLLNDNIVLEIQDGNHGELHPKSKDFTKDGIPFITANCIKGNKILLESCQHLSKEWLRKLRIGFAKRNDVILTHKGTLGMCAIVPDTVESVILSPQTTYYRLSERLSKEFLYYVFQSTFFQRQLSQLGRQSTREYVGITTQRKLLIPFVPINEQQRIASILSKMDELIQLRLDSIEHTQSLKIGLMQKLLTGKIRVKV